MKYHPDYPERIHPYLEDAIATGKTPYSNHPAIPEGEYLDNIASEQFREILEKIRRYYKEPIDDVTELMMALMSFYNEIVKIESEHTVELAKLAVKLVEDAYGIIPDEIKYKIKLGRQEIEIGATKDFTHEEEIKTFSPEIKNEVAKRVVINGLIQGAALRGQYLFHLAEDELEKISPDLVDLYGIIMSVAEYAYWVIPPSMVSAMGAGMERVNLSEDKPMIIAYAVIFPVLLQELVKGIVELVSLHGLPKDATIRQKVLDAADTLENETWGIRFGKEFWDKFLQAANVDDARTRMKVYEKIVSLPPDEFHSLIKGILSNDENAKNKVSQIIAQIRQYTSLKFSLVKLS